MKWAVMLLMVVGVATTTIVEIEDKLVVVHGGSTNSCYFMGCCKPCASGCVINC